MIEIFSNILPNEINRNIIAQLISSKNWDIGKDTPDLNFLVNDFLGPPGLDYGNSLQSFNEKENIAAIIKAVFSLDEGFHVLIVDDGSPDGTAAIVKEMQAQFPESLFIIERTGKLGLGTAYIAGFKWALERNYAFIFEMDAFRHQKAKVATSGNSRRRA
jgi:cellulose synthase/poly-beta-1,6-N-acetylglucosamine synthase-like glycosyltransferase